MKNNKTPTIDNLPYMVEDRAAIYAAMAEEDDNTDITDDERKRLFSPLFGSPASIPVVVGDRSVDVATIAYVKRLERLLIQQGIEIKKLHAAMRAMSISQRQNTLQLHAQNNITNDLKHELDNKVDRRD